MKSEFVIAILLTLAGIIKGQQRSMWYETLPNEKLEGVPRIIRDYERSFPAFKNMFLESIGRSNTDIILKEAIKRQVFHLLK